MPAPDQPKGNTKPPARGLRYLKLMLDNVNADELIELFIDRRKNGRPGYSPRAMLRAWLCKYLLGIRYNVDLIETLRRSSGLRRVCGFDDDEAPSETAMSRFTGRLTEYQVLVDDCFNQVTEAMREFLPDLGEDVAIDSTSIETYSNPNRKVVSDPDAQWGMKHKARAKKDDKKDETEKTESFFGYKLHTISDANHEVPLGMILTPGNRNDSPILPTLVNKVRKTFEWFKPKHLMADRGYDSVNNHRHLIEQGTTPVIHIRDLRRDKKSIYTAIGEPTCLGEQAMTYVRTDPETGHHLYRCPTEGCRLKTEGTKATTHCDDEVWIDPNDDIRVIGILPRVSEEWKGLYSKRMSIERLFKNTKQSRNLEGHLFRKMAKIQLHSTISMLTYSLTLLTRLQMGEQKVMKLRVKLA